MSIHLLSTDAHPAPWVRTTLHSAAIASVVLLMLLVGRGHPLQNLNEGLYARVAQEMLERHDFAVPTLDGVPYLEKPPLLYWVTAGALAAFGRSESVARLAPLLGAVLMLAAAAWFARRHLAPQAGAYALPILASAPLVVVLARTLMFDMLFTGLLFGALVLLYEAFTDVSRKRWLRASYALLALAVLTKGFAGALFYGLVALTLLLAKPRGARRATALALADPIAVALLLGIAAPWHFLAARQPGFAWFYVVNEHVLRFLGRRIPHDYHTGPVWYYLPRLCADFFPWPLLLLLPAQRDALDPQARAARRFLWIALLVPLAVFSLSEGKGEYYMIVGIPALALLAADRLARSLSPRTTLVSLAAAWLVVLIAAATQARAHVAPYALPAHFADDIALAAALAVAALAAGLLRWRLPAVLACAAVAVPCAAMYSNYFRANESSRSARSLARALRPSAAPVFVYRGYEAVSAVTFYLDRPVGVVDYRGGDLSYGLGLAAQPERFPDAADLARLAARKPLWLVVPKPELARFAASALPAAFVRQGSLGTGSIYASRPLESELARERAAPRAVSSQARAAMRTMRRRARVTAGRRRTPS
jgi:4-amino-4-deoxy-L-arabinose transferase-like glycosyltransferase